MYDTLQKESKLRADHAISTTQVCRKCLWRAQERHARIFQNINLNANWNCRCVFAALVIWPKPDMFAAVGEGIPKSARIAKLD
jgi:hypothetical protein